MRLHRWAVIAGAGALLATTALAEGPEGRWEGRARVNGQALPLVVEVQRDDGGALSGAMSLPTRGIFDRPVGVTLEGDDATLSLVRDGALGDATLAGTINDGLWRGTIDAMNSSGMAMTGAFALVHVIEVEREALVARVGDYEVDGLGLVRVVIDDSASGAHLTVFSEAMGTTTELFPVAPGRFVIGLDPADEKPIEAEVTFDDADGFALHMGERVMSATRVERMFAIDSAAIESIVTHAMDADGIPSVVVAIVHGDDIVYEHAFGFADIESGRLATVETPYQIGSITKTFTATLLALAREDGLVSLDDPIEELLPESVTLAELSAEERDAITLERLATHTSGLTRDPWNLSRRNGVKQPYDVDALYKGLRRARLMFAPGEGWRYSNFGFGLLGHAVSRAYGGTLEEALRAQILEPLGMDATFVALDDERMADVATHYWMEDEPRVARPYWVYGEVAGNGGLVSTAGDMAKWASAQLAVERGRGVAINSRALRATHSPRVNRNGPMHAIGLAWFLEFSPEMGMVISHGGEVDGHAAHLAIAPAQDVGVVVLGNLGGAAIGSLGDALMREAIEQARTQRIATTEEANAALLAGAWGDAAWAYGQLSRANAENGMAAYRYAVSAFELRRFDTAMEAFSQAAALGYGAGEAHFGMASICALRGDAGAAVAELEIATNLGVNVPARVAADTDFDSIRASAEFQQYIGALERESGR